MDAKQIVLSSSCRVLTCHASKHKGVTQGYMSSQAAVQPASAQPYVVATHCQELGKALQVELARGAECQDVGLLGIIAQLQQDSSRWISPSQTSQDGPMVWTAPTGWMGKHVS